MESHQRQIHFHLARAIMHLNYIAGFLPLVEPDLDWDSSPMLSGPSMPLAPSNFSTGSSNLHTFVPMLRSNHHATLLSHGGLPSHMTINPEPNLHPMRSSISMVTVAEEVYPAARPISSSSTAPPATRSTSASTPTAPPVRSHSSATPPTHHSVNPNHPKRRCLQPPAPETSPTALTPEPEAETDFDHGLPVASVASMASATRVLTSAPSAGPAVPDMEPTDDGNPPLVEVHWSRPLSHS